MSTWEKAFDTFQWENRSQSTNTPLDATHLNKVNDALDVIDDRVIELQSADADMEEEIAGKQDALTFDDVPTDGSNNPVKSNGIYDALNGKVNKNGTDRLMTAAEGTKLAGIAASAQVNVLEGVQVNGSDLPITDKKVNMDISGKTDLKVIAFPFHDPEPGEPSMGFFKGAYVTYNGKLYEFTQEHTGAWNPSHVREIDVDEMYVRAGNGGYNTGRYSTTEGHSTRAEGEASHAEGLETIANSDNQHVEGKYNIADTDNEYALIVGNGTGDNARSNAMTLDWEGNLRVSGDIADGNGDVTVEGNPVTFDSPFEQDAKSVVVSVKPIQDLHGYDYPWPAGGGKNKWSLSNSYTSTSSGHWVQIDTPFILPAGQYTLSYTDASSGQNAEFVIKDSSDNLLINFVVTSNGARCSNTITLSAASAKLAICMYGDARTISDIQIESGSTATSYVPYSNICPISGIDEVEIEVSDGESEPTTTTIPLPSTLYDADVDVTEGDADETKIIITVDNTWSYSTFAGKNYLTKDYTGVIKSYNQNPENPISSMCEFGGFGGAGMFEDGKFYQTSSDNYGDLYIQDSRYTTKETFLAAYGGCQICCELAIPTTLSFTPADVELLEGMNVVSTNAEKVAVTYGRSLWQDIDELKTDTEGKLDKSDVATIEGDTASKAYSVNDFMLRADGFYKVTAPIAQNASITSSNTTKTTVGEVLTALLNA